MPAAIDIDGELVRKLAAIGCTDAEIAMACNCSETTLKRKAREQLDAGRNRLCQSLRRLQIKTARKGNVTMQIWLGKQYLNQKDRQEVEQHGGTLRIVERIESGPIGADRPDHGEADPPPT
jgi:hypothetical protein